MDRRFFDSNPGRLIDGDLELIAPCEKWLDAMMAASDHPRTRTEMPEDAAMKRDTLLDFIWDFPSGFHPGEPDGSLAPAYHFWMLRHDDSDYPIAGGISLRLGHGRNIEFVIGHIGYHVYPFARGHHFAERACRLLLPLARRHGLDPLWITCNPDNLPSCRTCERLGAMLVDIVPVPPGHLLYRKGERQKCRYRLATENGF